MRGFTVLLKYFVILDPKIMQMNKNKYSILVISTQCKRNK